MVFRNVLDFLFFCIGWKWQIDTYSKFQLTLKKEKVIMKKRLPDFLMIGARRHLIQNNTRNNK